MLGIRWRVLDLSFCPDRMSSWKGLAQVGVAPFAWVLEFSERCGAVRYGSVRYGRSGRFWGPVCCSMVCVVRRRFPAMWHVIESTFVIFWSIWFLFVWELSHGQPGRHSRDLNVVHLLSFVREGTTGFTTPPSPPPSLPAR